MQGDTPLVVEPSLKTKEYVAGTIGMNFPGYVRDVDAAYNALYWGTPASTVIIRNSVKFHTEYRVERPHPDCKAEHTHKARPYTSIIARAFPEVAPEHRDVVRSLGAGRNFVVVPIIEPLEASWTA